MVVAIVSQLLIEWYDKKVKFNCKYLVRHIGDCGEIWNRLFDHRPFLNGEIKYFLKEFEEKRGDREVERMFEILEQATEIRDSQIDKAKSAASSSLPQLSDRLEIALKKSDALIYSQEKYNAEAALKAKREVRKAQWAAFVTEFAAKRRMVDSTFQEKEDELKAFYVDLETKLHIDA